MCLFLERGGTARPGRIKPDPSIIQRFQQARAPLSQAMEQVRMVQSYDGDTPLPYRGTRHLMGSDYWSFLVVLHMD